MKYFVMSFSKCDPCTLSEDVAGFDIWHVNLYVKTVMDHLLPILGGTFSFQHLAACLSAEISLRGRTGALFHHNTKSQT